MGREGDQAAIEDHALDARKAAVWCVLAAAGQVGILAAGDSWPLHGATAAVAYLMVLPMVAVLHVRHRPVRQSGAVLGTIAGATALVLGLVATVDARYSAAAMLALGIWWWTIGKMWVETDVMPRALGYATAALAAIAIASTLAPEVPALIAHAIIAVWLAGLAAAAVVRADVPSR